MNDQPKPNQPDQFSFEKEPAPETSTEPTSPEAQPDPVKPSIYPTPGAHTKSFAAPSVKLDRTSGIAMYMLAVASGLFAIVGASYLIGNVLRYFLVEKNNTFLYFDLSSIDLYFIVTTILFGLVHFVAMGLVQKGSSNIGLGFRRRHEAVSAFWQTLLALTILGSIVTLIYSPLDKQINGSDSMFGATSSTGELTATLLSAGFVLLLAAALLWRDRLVAKGNNAVIPAVVAGLLLTSVVVASIVMISLPKEKPKTPDYESMYGSSSSTSTSDFNIETSTDDEGASSSSSSSSSWNFDSTDSTSDSTDTQQP